MDLRYLKRASFGSDSVSDCVSEVVSCLESIYSSVAENIPDVRDDFLEDDCDPYALNLNIHSEASDQKQLRAKQHQRGVKIAVGRSVADGMEERFLPPGTMKEYWIQYKRQSQAEHKASFPTFWRVF